MRCTGERASERAATLAARSASQEPGHVVRATDKPRTRRGRAEHAPRYTGAPRPREPKPHRAKVALHRATPGRHAVQGQGPRVGQVSRAGWGYVALKPAGACRGCAALGRHARGRGTVRRGGDGRARSRGRDRAQARGLCRGLGKPRPRHGSAPGMPRSRQGRAGAPAHREGGRAVPWAGGRAAPRAASTPLARGNHVRWG
jgi:hypothetical protein